MKYVKWIFIVLFVSSLISFIEKDKPTSGLGVGDIAPDIRIDAAADGQAFDLRSMKGEYVLLSFWASYDVDSRMQNIRLNNALKQLPQDVKLVSISFDEYQSVFKETIRKDRIDQSGCYWETNGKNSAVFKDYALGKGFKNYLLDADGVIIAKNIPASGLSACLSK